ncbi:MAG: hypothetical protein PHS54_00720 [Clostridia bacterium]|nr:hypothetical protein [Clostridia bacterium]
MRENIICSRYYNAKLLHWVGNRGIAYISDLEGHEYPAFCPIYNDACDEGFGLIGRRRDVIFAVDKTVTDGEHEIVKWILKSISEPGFEITLYND